MVGTSGRSKTTERWGGGAGGCGLNMKRKSERRKDKTKKERKEMTGIQRNSGETTTTTRLAVSVVAAAVTGPDRPEPPQEVPRHKEKGEGECKGHVATAATASRQRPWQWRPSHPETWPRVECRNEGRDRGTRKGRQGMADGARHPSPFPGVRHLLPHTQQQQGNTSRGGHGDTAKEQPASVSPLWRVGLEA